MKIRHELDLDSRKNSTGKTYMVMLQAGCLFPGKVYRGGVFVRYWADDHYKNYICRGKVLIWTETQR
jgi:hypothetical protein